MENCIFVRSPEINSCAENVCDMILACTQVKNLPVCITFKGFVLDLKKSFDA